MSLAGRYLTFSLGAQTWAVRIDAVREIVAPQPVTPVPRAPTSVLGAFNLRGRVLPLLDPRPALGVESGGDTETTVFVVLARDVDGDEVRFSVHVNAVDEVLDLTEDACSPRRSSPAVPSTSSVGSDAKTTSWSCWSTSVGCSPPRRTHDDRSLHPVLCARRRRRCPAVAPTPSRRRSHPEARRDGRRARACPRRVRRGQLAHRPDLCDVRAGRGCGRRDQRRQPGHRRGLHRAGREPRGDGRLARGDQRDDPPERRLDPEGP
ncbi:MAG: hypothetical protein GY913_08300 [Proteobacteria bacterium]|nr:hypothetical protein [Pseudomonadota bacterium]MCP4916911.1 hypothetical protein [Pseudomonadota bacterium]